MSLIIHAPNVHQGGGRALLLALLGSLCPGSVRQVVLDARLKLNHDLPSDVQVECVAPTISARLMAEWRLRRVARTEDTVLCFGNLPPLFPLRARVVVYIQNRYHVDRRGSGRFPAARYRLWFEHRWFDLGRRWVDEFVVQTPSMQRDIKKRLSIQARVLPFVDNIGNYSRRANENRYSMNRKYDFVYVATGEPHKNHANLIEAWCVLASEGHRPTLCVTLSPGTAPELCRWIEGRRDACGLNIEMLGELGADEVKELYRRSGALIYPSTFESFGLPLIEARQAGLPIIASELDYVRDLVDPEDTFDPGSEVSIARAVKRFLKIRESVLYVVDAKTFLTRVIEGERS